MRRRGRLLLLLFLITAVILALFLFLRPQPTEAEYGAPVALCPGPDLYGYTCANGSNYAYIDATNNTNLFVLDGAVTVELPFPFTFYNTTYTQLNAISNGNIQFDSANINFVNTCLYPETAVDMGAMLAPYWSDLDLSFTGALEWEIVGSEPERIFVLEWDSVPPFGHDLDDTVTFEVQLFEGSNDIVFLYQDVVTSLNGQGSQATIGLQNTAQGLALQFSCNQPAVNNAAGLLFENPITPNPTIKPEDAAAMIDQAKEIQTREPLTTLLGRLSQSNPGVLAELQQHWLQQRPSRSTEWIWTDVTGNGRDELVILWRPNRTQPNRPTSIHTEIAVIAYTAANQPSLLWQQILGNREHPFSELTFVETADLTGDLHNDILLHSANSGQTLVITAVSDSISLHQLPESCNGRAAIRDNHIIRTGCTNASQILTTTWNGETFSPP